MKREVGVFIESNYAQEETDYFRLELFNDEKISVSSTIQNIADLSKIFTDFSQGFTIPCSPTNNAIFKHFYQNDVNTSFIIDYQIRFNAYIEIDNVLFRRGKIQLEKASIKDGQPNSYSVTFYGEGVSLKDFFGEGKLSQLDYSSVNHAYNQNEVYNRITIDSSVTDYDVRYPFISSKRVWQFGASVPVPTDNLPTWYEYPIDNSNNLNDKDGRIYYTELFPAVRCKILFDLIADYCGVTFNGLFLNTDMFRKAFLWFKNKETKLEISGSENISFYNTSGDLGFSFLPSGNVLTMNDNLNSLDEFGGGTGEDYTHLVRLRCVSLSTPTRWYLDVFVNGVFDINYTATTTSVNFPYTKYYDLGDIITFQVRTENACTAVFQFSYARTSSWDDGWGTIQTATITGASYGTATTSLITDLASYAPDMKIADFVHGMCKEFNMTVYSIEKNVFTFIPINDWYGKGLKYNITQYTDVTGIEIERMKLYKTIEFKYQESESFMNKYFLESLSNIDGHGYGDLKKSFNYDGGEYKIESPFENLLHCNFGNQLQVGYSLNKEFASYIPKPVLLYMNQVTTLANSEEYFFDLSGTAQGLTNYIPFGQDSNILTTQGLIPLTLNFGAEISSYYNSVNPNTLYNMYYSAYLINLYNNKNRLVKVKTILPLSILTKLQLNDRLIIRDKRYMINEMESDLTTGEVNFSLISDFALIKPITLIAVEVNKPYKININIAQGSGVIAKTKSTQFTLNGSLSQTTIGSNGELLIVIGGTFTTQAQINIESTLENGEVETQFIVLTL